jgi:hypothetical protein
MLLAVLFTETKLEILAREEDDSFLSGCDRKWVQAFRENQWIVMRWIFLVFERVAGWESGGSVSLLSRTSKARASRQFLECDRGSCRFSPTLAIVLDQRSLHSTF